MGGVNKEQITTAKQVDLLTYLQKCEPNAIKKCGNNAYQLKEHDSLKISNCKWNWFSRGIGGKTALDFLIHVRGMDFVSAVQTILDGRASPIVFSEPVKSKENKPKVPFVLPEQHWDNFRVIAYLQNRGIDREVIDRCISEKVLYEGKKNHSCVFIGRDNKHKAKFACLRGIYGRFLKDVDGSDKQYSFSVPTREPHGRSLMVFESSIDALSQATLDKQSEIGSSWDCFGRLSLGGTSPLALMQYLKEYSEVDCVSLCLDNDDVGQKTAIKIKNILDEMKHPLYGKYNVSITPPTVGKDYNDMLLIKIKENKCVDTDKNKSDFLL